jgi:hypothetical protein
VRHWRTANDDDDGTDLDAGSGGNTIFIEAGDTPFSNVTMPEVQLSSVQFSCCQGILFIRQMR